MKTKWNCLTFICGLGLCSSVVAQTNDAVQVEEPVQIMEADEAVAPPPIALEDTKASKWNFDVSLYLLAPGMSGDVTIKNFPETVDVDFDKIWDNLHMAGMGFVRIGYGKWSLETDVIYMDLQGGGETKTGAAVDVELTQWMVEPTLSYRFNPKCLVLAGARYNNLNTEISRTGILNSQTGSGTQDWWDPVIGGAVNLPFAKTWSFNFYGDIGGFGVGSELAWQVFPYVGWQFTSWGSMQFGYRWLYMDYENSDDNFAYDVLTQGPQIGLTASF